MLITVFDTKLSKNKLLLISLMLLYSVLMATEFDNQVSESSNPEEAGYILKCFFFCHLFL
jgi:hypothetical protein